MPITLRVVYLGSYDYAGIASITIDGEVTVEVHMKRQDLLKLVLVRVLEHKVSVFLACRHTPRLDPFRS